jgi:hypothetical protein
LADDPLGTVDDDLRVDVAVSIPGRGTADRAGFAELCKREHDDLDVRSVRRCVPRAVGVHDIVGDHEPDVPVGPFVHWISPCARAREDETYDRVVGARELDEFVERHRERG